MSKRSQGSDFLQQAPVEQDVIALIKRMQQQLAFLEKKIDILINQTQARPFSERHFPKPFRSSGRPHRHSAGERDTVYGERSGDRRQHFEKRRGETTQSFGYRRKAYDTPRESEGEPEHHFEKRRGGEQREFNGKKKPFYNKRKGRG